MNAGARQEGEGAAGEDRLAVLQAALCDIVSGLDDAACRARWHPALSPIGWHLRHCVFVEALWIRERVLGDDRLTAPLAASCLPERAPKDLRAEALPPRRALVGWARTVMAENRALLKTAPRCPLTANGYLRAFLAAHLAQHLETVRLALAARRLAGAAHRVARPLRPSRPAPRWRAVPAGGGVVGADGGGRRFVYDNEAPAFRVRSGAFGIAAAPVDNAAWLAFMEAEGAAAPFGWRRDPAGAWFGVGADGSFDLPPGAPVAGISHPEARAFARWAGARLPHEYEWELAARHGVLEGVGAVWEWCANAFHPYPGFRWRPYREYSTPWFGSRHAVLRGAGRYAERENRRASFRNFHPPESRHIAAGLRLARDGLL